MNILSIIILALMGEAIWESLKLVWQDSKLCIDKAGAIAVCLVLSFGARLDLFELIGLPLSIPYAGTFLTGLLTSRGANFVHDLYSKIQK